MAQNFSPTVISVLRRKKGLTQTKLAAAVNRSQGEISQYETRSAKPTEETLRLIAKELGIKDPSKLLQDWGNEFETTSH